MSEPIQLAFMGRPDSVAWLVLCGVGLLFFCWRLPSAVRALSSGIVEFKKGLQGNIEDADFELNEAPRHV